MTYPPLKVKVWGQYACVTRPESKVERVSYSVLTPSSARGVLEAIFWKPEFDYRIRKIEVLRPIRFVSIMRNEVELKASSPDGISATDARQQRHTLALYDVAYIIHADIETRRHATTNVDGYRAQFRERVSEGRCFHRPYLGCREFSCDFGVPDPGDTPCDVSTDLGLMLFDVVFKPDKESKSLRFYRHGGRTESGRERREETGLAMPLFFSARLERGVLRVPPELYAQQSALLGGAA